MSDAHWIGVDLGGTKILAGLFNHATKLIGRAKEATPPPAQGPGAVFDRIGRAVERVLQESGVPARQVGGLGLGLPGQIDPKARRVIFAPNLDWRDLDTRSHLPATWTWPTFIENDVRIGTF